MAWQIDSDTVCLVTGASAGIGLETARGLARRGATVIITGRNPERTPRVARELSEETSNPHVEYELVDFSELAQVRSLAERVLARHPRLDVLINNAGVWHPRPVKSRDGFDDHIAVNHLAPFLLTNLLRGRLEASAPARVVHVSSRLHRGARAIRLKRDGKRNGFDPFGFRGYAESKLAGVVFSTELARRLEGSGVTSNALHPGDVATSVARDTWLTRVGIGLLRPFLKTPEQGAATTLFVASAPELSEVSGRYFADCRERPASPLAGDRALADELWRTSAELTGVGTCDHG
jgi:NAD(P)-dependent dehydrogenase (short-subunit alcohol dehydrogenase family)